jgi:uncharacterized protein involved in exopolysaccharide biosynthesis
MFTPNAAAEHDSGEVTPLRVTNFLLRNRRRVVMIPMGLALLVGIGNLFTSRKWTSSATFMPQASAKNPGAKIAQEFGVDIGAGDDAQNSPMFYVELLTSRPLLSAAVLNRYTFVSGKDTISGNLIELFDSNGKSEGRRLLEAMGELKDDLSVSADIRTGTVQLSIKTHWPQLSKAILDKLLADVNDFNSKIRRSRAGAERDFVASQLAEARANLRQAEDRLQAFNQQNRVWQNDPALIADHERIAREVALSNLRYSTLTQNLDQAAIDAVRNTPVLTVIEPPLVPPKSEGRGTVTRTLLAFLVCAFFGTLLSLFREYEARSREAGSEDLQQFTELRREIWSSVQQASQRVRPRRASAA